MNSGFAKHLGERDATLKLEAAERYAATFADTIRVAGNTCEPWLQLEIFDAFIAGCHCSKTIDMESNQEMLKTVPGEFLNQFIADYIRTLPHDELVPLILKAIDDYVRALPFAELIQLIERARRTTP